MEPAKYIIASNKQLIKARDNSKIFFPTNPGEINITIKYEAETFNKKSESLDLNICDWNNLIRI